MTFFKTSYGHMFNVLEIISIRKEENGYLVEMKRGYNFYITEKELIRLSKLIEIK